MATYSAGDARLAIYPDASNFKRRLEEQLKAIEVEYKIRTEADTAPAERTTEEYRAREEAKPVKTKLELDLDRAERDLRELRIREAAHKLGIRVDVDTEHADTQLRLLRAEQEARAIKIRLDVDTDQFAGIGEDFGKLFSGGLTSPASITGIVGLLPAAADGIGQVAAAIQQLAGAAPVLPGALAGLAAIAATVKLGMTGVDAAFKAVDKSSDGTAKSVEAANKALAGLAPSAADAVKTAVRLKDELGKALTLPVQQNLFDGLSQSAQKLYDSDIPLLQQRLPQLASSLNDIAKQALDSLGSDSSKSFIDRILGNTSTATSTIATAVQPIINALGQVSAAGSNALPRLADDIKGVADEFNAFITNASNSGALDTWIRNGITGFEQLADTAGHIVDAISSIADAAGGDLLSNLDQVTGKFAAWLNSTDGRQELTTFLDEGKKQLGDIITIVQNLGPAFGAAFHGAATAVGEVLGPLKLVTDAFAALPDWAKSALTKGAEGALNPTALGAQLLDQDNTRTARDGADAALRDAQVRAPKGGVPAVPSTSGGPAVSPGVGPFAVPAPAHPVVGPPAAPPAPAPPPAGTHNPFAGYKTGGVLPGFSPGVDNLMVPMSGGEGVIIPTVTRQLGAEGIAAINAGALTRGFAPGGVVPTIGPDGNPITPGSAPGPGGFVPGAGVAPVAGSASGGLGGIFGSILSGLGGPLGNIAGIASGAGGAGGGTSASGFTSTGSFMDRMAGIPGLAGLIGSEGSSDPGAALKDWGGATGKWLGQFTAKTVGGFGNALWSGALGLVGLDNSILSPSNPWFQDAAKGAGFALDDSGPLGALLGVNGSKTGSKNGAKGATPQQVRSAGEKVQRADQRVDEIQQRISELKPTAKASERQSLNDQLADAQQQSTDARTDLATLSAGGSTSSLPGSTGARPAVAGAQAAVYQAMLDAGFPASEWSPLKNIVDRESGWNPTAKNPSSGAYGLFQFLGHQNDQYGQLGGYSGDPAQEAVAGMQYIKDRYGSPSAAWAHWQANGSYANGGVLPGYSPGVDNMLVPMSGGEGVIIPTETRKLGPAGIAAINRGALTKGYYGGGIVDALLPQPPSPSIAAAKDAQAHQITTPGGHAQIPNANLKQLPAPVAPPGPVAPAVPPGPPAPNGTPSASQYLPGVGPASVGPAPTDYNHNLAAVNTGIASGASAIGNAVSMIAGVAGGSGFAPGAGAIGQIAAGAIQEGGKAVTDLVNVGSSFLVGSVPGNLGGDGPASGQLMTSPQNVPNTAQDNRRSYSIQAGYQPSDLIDAIQLHDSQMAQADLARFRG